MTLEELKAYKLKASDKKKIEEYFQHNREVCRSRMSNNQVDWEIWDMTHDGNNIMPNDVILKRAKTYLNFYTDEEWNKYFIPAINEAIDYNNNFVRYYPGYLVKHKETGKLAIVEYDYDYAFGHQCFGAGHDWEDLSLCFLDEDQKQIDYTSAWHDHEDYELVDKDNTEKYIKMIVKHHKKHRTIPIALDPEVIEMYYK